MRFRTPRTDQTDVPSLSSSAQQARELLGQRLREIRLDSGLTARDLGKRAGWHPSKVSKIEYARRAPSAADIRLWCECCEAEDQSADLIASLRAVEGMFIEWRRMERTGLRVAQEVVAPLFVRTRLFRVYDSWLVPGPLQTRSYTAAVLEGLARSRGIPDDVEAAVSVRVDRTRVLRERQHRFAVVLEEPVLRYRLGGCAVMADQLSHLLEIALLPSVSVGIIPAQIDRPRSPVEGFWIFDEARVNVELVSGWLTVTQPHEVALYARTFGELHALAVYGADARALIASAMRALDM